MNAMTKAHEIRRAAAERFNCKVSEIHFGECLRLAHQGETMENCTKEIWNAAAAMHTRKIAGLQKIIQKVGLSIGATTGQEVMDHLYNDFLNRKESGQTGGKKASYYTFGFYLNCLHN